MLFSPTTRKLLPVLLVTMSIVGCQAVPADPADGHRAITTSQLEPFECGNIKRLHTFEGVFLASQPTVEDLTQAQKGGVKTVINQRHSSEQDFDEREVVTSLGLEYENPAFNGPDELSDRILDETLSLLRTKTRPILLHCSSANRVGAVWFAYRALDGGLDPERALAEAKVVGLRSPDYERIVRDYIERRR